MTPSAGTSLLMAKVSGPPGGVSASTSLKLKCYPLLGKSMSEIGTIIIPVWKTGRLRHREVVRCHTEMLVPRLKPIWVQNLNPSCTVTLLSLSSPLVCLCSFLSVLSLFSSQPDSPCLCTQSSEGPVSLLPPARLTPAWWEPQALAFLAGE